VASVGGQNETPFLALARLAKFFLALIAIAFVALVSALVFAAFTL
jgi:hypothetical protein